MRETQAKLGGTGRKGAGILALSLTLLSVSRPLLPGLLHFLLLFFLLFFPPFFLFFFFFILPLLLPSFFPSLHLPFIFILSVPSFLSPLPVLPSLPLVGTQGWLAESLGVGVLFSSACSRCGRNLPRKGSHGTAVGACGSGPGLPLHRQGLGYDHDRMAAALRSYSVGPQPQPERFD